jgi:hypothetical protein
MVALIAAILVASWVIDSDSSGGGGDAFGASRAWLYVAIVGSAYTVSRGLAKAGSSEPYWTGPDDLPTGRRDEYRAGAPRRPRCPTHACRAGAAAILAPYPSGALALVVYLRAGRVRLCALARMAPRARLIAA